MRRPTLLILAALLAACAAPVSGPTPQPQPPATAGPRGTPGSLAGRAEVDITVPTTPPRPTATSVPTVTAARGSFASELGVAVQIPAGWLQERPDRDGDLQWFYPPGQEVLTLLYTFSVPHAGDLDAAVASARDASTGWLSDVEEQSSAPHTLADGRAAWRHTYTGTRDGREYLVRLTTSVRGRHMFTLFAYGDAAEMAAREGQLDRLADSMTLSAPLRYGIPEDQALLDLGGESSNPHAYDPAHAGGDSRVFSGLTTFTPDLRLAGDLAESWDVSPDGMTYTFHLRPNARFHNGRPMTAADVIYSWDRAAAPETDSQSVLTYLGDIVGLAQRHAGEASAIAGLRALDDHTLEVRIDAPKPYFPMKLSYVAAFIVDHENIASGAEWYRTPNGTGPFRLARWEPGVVRIYERNPDFYLGPPALPYIIEQLYAGYGLRLYEQGSLDWTGVGGLNLERARDPQGPFAGQLYSGISMCTSYIGIDTTRPPFDDLMVRQAFALAVDRVRLAELSQDGDLPASGLFPPAMPGYQVDLAGQRFDPEAAKRMLAESSYGGAERLPEIVFSSSGYGSEIGQQQSALAEMWQRHLGVTINFRNLEPNYWREAMHAGKHGQLYSYGWCADYPDPENFADALFHTGAQENLGDFSDAQLDGLLERARVEPDVAARIALYQQAEQRIIDQAAAIFLMHGSSHMLVQPRIQGYVLTPIGVPIERYLSIAEE
jgi:oligopeptide transport system substrate-binding protein